VYGILSIDPDLMKRAVAIQGPTPSFLRWAIEYHCPLRELHPLRLPETTFRQLRSLREISLARSDQRIHLGFCWHPSALTQSPQQALGFPVEEVLDLFGGETLVDSLCHPCPANAVSNQRSENWAGCYGSLATDLSVDFARLLRGEYQTRSLPPTDDIYNLILIAESIIGSGKLPDFPGIRELDQNQLSWYGLWCDSPLPSDRLRWLERLLAAVLEHCREVDRVDPRNHSPHKSEQQQPADPENDGPAKESPPFTGDLQQMLDGMRRAMEFKLPFYVELVPAGFSDGVSWTIQPHCGRCRQSLVRSRKQCPFCGPAGSYQNEIKLKVLGIRPYLLVKQIVGVEQTEKLLAEYACQKTTPPTEC
jgi:hypothetical protein